MGTLGVFCTVLPLPATVDSARLQRGQIGLPAMSTVHALPLPGQVLSLMPFRPPMLR